jgi:hypothetical protein
MHKRIQPQEHSRLEGQGSLLPPRSWRIQRVDSVSPATHFIILL